MVSDSNGVGADIESVREDIKSLKRDVSKLMGDVRAATSGRAEQLYTDLRDNGSEAVRERVRARPIASLALAFLAGMFVARVLRR